LPKAKILDAVALGIASWHEEHLFCSIIWLYKAKVPFDSGHLTLQHQTLESRLVGMIVDFL